MLRIANPGSDIPTFVRVFRELFDELNQLKSFTLDDMSATLVARNLMTSSGYMGSEALERGFREDRSRDAPYNQSKMYSELLRVLGWIHPTDARLRFKFTFLGAHMVSAHPDAVTLIDQCLIGIAVPNPFVEVRTRTRQRPFAAILRAADELDGMITRDEMIIGPLSLVNDRDREEWSEMIALIQNTRGSKTKLDNEITRVGNARRITSVTMRNYTRFPVAALPDIGWADRIATNNIYGRGVPFLRLTEYGARTVRDVRGMLDLRAEDLERFDPTCREAAIRLGFYQLLSRAGFDTSPFSRVMSEDSTALQARGIPKRELLFSPFQELMMSDIVPLFPDIAGAIEGSALTSRNQKAEEPTAQTLVPLISGLREVSGTEPLTEVIREFGHAGLSPEQIATLMHAKYANANKTEFYPLIAGMFRVLGFDCENPRPGVNYQRYDAIIKDPRASIPIEIKSPGEELFLSVKAVRQALENKVILLSRAAFASDRETTSLVIGYNLPNDRSEVVSLTEDILRAFALNIGIIDFQTLVRLAAEKVLNHLTPEPSSFGKLSGILNVAYAQ